MALTSGTSFILKINTGTTGSPVYTTIGACTTHSITHSYASVDVTNKDSVWTTFLDGAGKKSTSLEFTGFVPEDGDDAGFEELKAVSDSTTESQRLFEIVLGDGEKITGIFEVVTVSDNAPDGQAKTFSASLVSSGPLTRASV